jgi:hypothetical protein
MTQNNDARDIVGTVAHMKKKGTLKFLIIALSVGIAMLIIGSFVLPDDKEEVKSSESESTTIIGFFEYKKLLEDEIGGVCSTVDGVRNVSVVVFFSDVGGSIYAQNTQSGNANSQKVEYVVIGSGSNAHALYIGESLPKLSGIGVVCDTGGDLTKRNEILALLSAAYGLPMTRIYVSEAG